VEVQAYSVATVRTNDAISVRSNRFIDGARNIVHPVAETRRFDTLFKCKPCYREKFRNGFRYGAYRYGYRGITEVPVKFDAAINTQNVTGIQLACIRNPVYNLFIYRSADRTGKTLIP